MNNIRMPRDQYLDRLIDFKDKPVIKAIVGIRRCGKSTLLEMYKDHLASSGVDPENIISMNFAHAPFTEMTADDVKSEARKRTGRIYILLDEVQMLESWDKMALDLFENVDCDICITGSNSVMFSSKLSTLLSGRAVTIEMFPFSYVEFLRFAKTEDSDKALTEYMTYGGFPLALMVRGSKDAETAILEDVYSTVVLKDIVMRKNIRNEQMLDRISRFLMRNIGNPVSVKSIRDYMTSNGLKVNFDTVDDYLGCLEESLTFYRAKRYNIKTKEELVVNDKFYLSDLGIRTAVLGRREADVGRIMENLVYLELRRRRFTVYVGKLDDNEIDFVAMDGIRKVYVQVCYSLKDPDTEFREIRPLKAINDHHRKIVVVMERSMNSDRDGISEIELREFLKGTEI
ncbi:MAG: ATP-binding protein [Candidatus Methanoplasma sp.]|jgi:predicted AAA+ superfamily ATPase|nr:ATP-binding protein [Candidatus Methanoplasma sp.]